MSGRELALQLGAFLGVLAWSALMFAYGWWAGQPDPGNFVPGAILDLTQVEVRMFSAH